jgi:hypothetical protein
MCRMNARAAWASGNHEASLPDDDYDDDYIGVQVPSAQAAPAQGPAHAVIGEMAGLLRDTRGELAIAGCVLGAILTGFALEAGSSVHAYRPGVVGVINLVVLCGLLLSWLIAALVLAWASRPVLNALSELRWVTGAPLDPRARWMTLPRQGVYAAEWTWGRAHLLLAAARLARYRMQLAKTWACLAGGCFLAWTVITIFGL